MSNRTSDPVARFVFSSFLKIKLAASLQTGTPVMPGNRGAAARRVRRFVSDDDGADLVEYALLATIVAVGGYFVLSDFVLGVDGLLARVVSRLTALLS